MGCKAGHTVGKIRSTNVPNTYSDIHCISESVDLHPLEMLETGKFLVQGLVKAGRDRQKQTALRFCVNCKIWL